MADRTLRVMLVGDATSLIAAAQAARMELTGLANTNLGTLRGGLQGVGSASQAAAGQVLTMGSAMKIGLGVVGVQAGLMALTQGIRAFMSAGLDYQANMNILHAVTQATDAQMRSLGDTARKLGEDITIPGANAADAAAAMKELAKGGLTVQQSMDAARGALLLAAAAEVSAADAAKIEASALNAFRLSADQSVHVADLLANAANGSLGGINDMAQALQQSATVAGGFNISIGDTVTSLALFAKNGIIGSDAGTSLKTALTQLASPTKQQSQAMQDLNLHLYDSKGAFVGMKSVATQLSASYSRMNTEQYQLAAGITFGTDAIRIANVLGREGAKGWDNMNGIVKDGAGVQQLASAQTLELNGALNAMSNTATSSSLALYTRLQPALTAVAWEANALLNGLGKLADAFGLLPAPVQAFAVSVVAVTLLKGPLQSLALYMMYAKDAVVGGMAKMSLGIKGLSLSFETLKIAAVSSLTAIKTAFMTNPIGVVLVAATTLFALFSGGADKAAAAVTDYTDAIDENTGALKANGEAQKILAEDGKDDAAAFYAIGGAVGDWTAALAGNEPAIGRVNGAIQAVTVAALQGSNTWATWTAQAGHSQDSIDGFATALLAGHQQVALGDEALLRAVAVSQKFASAQDTIGGKARQVTAKLAEQEAAAKLLAKAGTVVWAVMKDVQAAIDGVNKAMGDNMTTIEFKDVLAQSKTAEDAAKLAADALTASLLGVAGGEVAAAKAAREGEAAMRGIGSAARQHDAALRSVTSAQEALNKLQAHGTNTAEDVANAQKAADKAAKDVLTSQQDLLKAQENARQSVLDAQATAAKQAADAAKTEQTDREDIAKAQASAAKDVADAEAQLAKDQAEADKNIADAQNKLAKDQAAGEKEIAKAKDDAEKDRLASAKALSDAQTELSKARDDAAREIGLAQARVDKLASSSLYSLAEKADAARHLRDAQALGQVSVGAAQGKVTDVTATGAASAATHQGTVNDAVTKNAETVAADQQAIRDAVDKSRETIIADQQAVRDAQGKGAEAVAAAQAKLAEDQAKAAEDAIKSARDLKDANQSAADSVTSAQQAVVDAADSAAAAQKSLADEQAKSIPSASDLADAEAAVADANARVADASDAQAAALDKAAQAARDAAAAAYTKAGGDANLEVSSKAAGAEMELQRQKFIDSAMAAGYGADEANRLADEQGLIPKDVETFYGESGHAGAVAKAKALQEALDAIPGVKTVHFVVVGDMVIPLPTSSATTGTTMAQDLANAIAVSHGYQPYDYAGANANAQAANHGYGAYDYGSLLTPTKASGGWITGPGGPTTDSITAHLSNGEFVVNTAQASKHRSLLENINNGTGGYAAGGAVNTANAAGSIGLVVQGAVAAPDLSGVDKAWSGVGDSIKTTWDATVSPTLDALNTATLLTGTTFTDLQTKTVEPTWTANADAVATATNRTILPTFDALNTGTALVGQNNRSLRDDAVVPAWSQMSDKVGAVVSGFTGGTFPAFLAGLGALGAGNAQLAASTALSWQQIGASVDYAYTSQIVPAWTGVQGFDTAMGAFFAGIATGMGTASTTVTTDLATITKAIDEFFKMVDLKAPVVATPTAAVTTSTGSIGLQAVADGGIITAGTGPRTDDVHIRASKGEYVVNAASTAQHRAELDRINYGGSYADGGLIGEKIGNRVGNAIIGGAEKAIGAGVDRVLASVPATGSGGTSTASGFTSSQDPSSFGWVRAANMVPYSWQGRSFGLTAAGTEGLWTALLNFIAPLIPGGINSDVGIFEDRNIAGTNTPSFHAYGLAMDIDSGANSRGLPGYGRTGQYEIPGEPAHAIAAKLGMEWGGDWGFTDPMHFEIHVPPSGISAATSGAAGTTAPVASPNAPPPTWLDSILAKIKAGGTGASTGGGLNLIVGPPGVYGTTRLLDTIHPMVDHGPVNMGHATAAMIGPVPPGGLEERWRPLYVQALAMAGKNPLGIDKMMYQMHRESSGIPESIEETDRNFQGGHPSKGLLQTIPSTFEGNAPAGYNTNIWDPLSNALASLFYIKDPLLYPGGPYDNGGMLQPGWNFNGLNSPEPVLTDQQWAVASRALNYTVGTGGGMGDVTVNARVFIGDREITDIARVEAEVVLDSGMSRLGSALTRQAAQS